MMSYRRATASNIDATSRDSVSRVARLITATLARHFQGARDATSGRRCARSAIRSLKCTRRSSCPAGMVCQTGAIPEQTDQDH